jgi:pimeloyl-ACP methyl ester carboxylesterase
MPTVQANGLTLDYVSFSDPAAPPIVLIMRLGMPAVAWPDAFLNGLVARGFRLISFDNGDAGKSTKFGVGKMPNLPLRSRRNRCGSLCARPTTSTTWPAVRPTECRHSARHNRTLNIGTQEQTIKVSPKARSAARQFPLPRLALNSNRIAG